MPVGGGGAWPGFETTRRAKLAARTARGRAAAHGRTKQPGLARHTTRAAGPDGAQNISGATSNKTARPGCRRARLRYPWAAAGHDRASRGSSTTHSDTSDASVEGAGGPGCGARGRRRGLAGLRDDAPSEARSADGSRAGRRPRAHQAARPSKAHHAGGRTRRRPEHQRRHKQRAPDTRKPRPADAGRGQPTQSGGKV